MGSLGGFTAITSHDLERLLTEPKTEAEIENLARDLENAAEDKYWQSVHKSWDGIHRCLSDGTLEEGGGSYPLNICVLFGITLLDYSVGVYVKSPADVVAISRALDDLTPEWLRHRYDSLEETDYEQFMSEEDWEYTLAWFEIYRDFYREAAQAGRAVMFTHTS